MRRLGRRQIDAGIHFLVPCGTTGENPTLTDAERLRIVEILVDEAAGSVPVLAGAGGYNTRRSFTSRSEMRKAGAAGLLSVTPYYNKPTQEGLYPALPRDRREHAAADRRLQRAGPDRREHRAGDARAARGDSEHRRREGSVRQHHPDVRGLPRRAADFIVLSGDDAMTLPLMAIGGRGVISVASNEIPAEMVQMVEAAERGDFAAARAVHAASCR